MDLCGGVVGGLVILGYLGDEGLDRKGPGLDEDFRCWFSRFLKSMSCSNFSLPGLNELTLEGVGCLGGVLGGYLDSGNFDVCAYVGEELLVLD